MPNWAVLGGFGKCHPHYRVHIAGSLPLLCGPTRCNIPAPNSERAGFRTQNSVFPKVPFGPKWARMVPMAYAPISYVPIRVPLMHSFFRKTSPLNPTSVFRPNGICSFVVTAILVESALWYSPSCFLVRPAFAVHADLVAILESLYIKLQDHIDRKHIMLWL